MAVLSPGSTAYHSSAGLLRGEGADSEVVERRLARGVGPILVMLDGGVRRDRQDSAAQAATRSNGSRVSANGATTLVSEDGSESMRVEVRQRGLRAAAQLAGVVDEQVQGAVPAHGSEARPGARVGDRAGDCLDGGVTAELRRDLGEPVGTTRVGTRVQPRSANAVASARPVPLMRP